MHCQPVASETNLRPASELPPHLSFGATHWRRLETAVALTFAVPLKEMRATSRSRADAAFARQVVMYTARVGAGMSPGLISRLSRRDRTTVAHACLVVEQRREDPAFNRVLHLLEDFCREIAADHGESEQVRS